MNAEQFIDHIAHRGKPHLARHGEDIALCSKTAPFWYRVIWDGNTKGVCKNCIKKLNTLKEESSHVPPVS